MRDYMDQSRFHVTPDILRLAAALDEFKGQWLAFRNLPPELIADLEHQAIVKATAAGIRLAGQKVSDTQVAAILAVRGEADRSNDDARIAGYAKVIRTVTYTYGSIPFTADHIKKLHRVMADPGAGVRYGEYRRDEDEEIDSAMQQLVDWVESSLAEGRLHPLLIIAAFMIEFLNIRPFAADNTRLSRLLLLLLLLKCGYDFTRYYALNSVIEEEAELFQQGLDEGLQRLQNDNIISAAWLLAFLQILRRQTRHIRDSLVELRRTVGRHDLEQKIIKYVRRHGQATNKLIQGATGANRNTIKVHLRKLVESGELIRHGRGKSCCYTLGVTLIF